jgi:hypothetical protein
MQASRALDGSARPSGAAGELISCSVPNRHGLSALGVWGCGGRASVNERGLLHRFLTSWRCQPSSVSGRMKNDCRLALLELTGCARKTRSLSSSRGRATCRRRTASWWRSTTISSSLNSRERNRSAATANTRRNSRYSNDTTKQRLPPPESEEDDSTAANPLQRTVRGARRNYVPHVDRGASRSPQT